MVADLGARRVAIDAPVFADVERENGGHSLFCRVPGPGAQNKVFAADLDIKG